jgi:hypothetical protein
VKTEILYLQECEVNAFQSTVLQCVLYLFQQTYQSWKHLKPDFLMANSCSITVYSVPSTSLDLLFLKVFLRVGIKNITGNHI